MGFHIHGRFNYNWFMPVRSGPAHVATPARYEFKPSPFSSHCLLLALLPAQGHGQRVLDVGCASGYMAEILTAQGYAVIGIDKPGASSGSFPPTATLIPADLDSGLPPLSGTFQFILCADVLEHLRDPLKFLREIRAYMAPGGKLLASLPNSGNLYFRLIVILGRFPQHDRGLFDRTHLHFYTWAGWLDLFSKSGFMIEGVRCSGVPLGLALPRWKDSLLVRWLEFAAYWMARAWKRLFAYQFVVVARPEAGS